MVVLRILLFLVSTSLVVQAYVNLLSHRGSHHRSIGVSRFLSLSGDGFERWQNPNIPASRLEELWRGRDSLLTIGSAGVSKTHINSLSNLIDQHETVRIKLASNKMDAMGISKQFMDDEALCSKVELLEVRKKEFMVGRKKD
mmetsp:Transcript_27701/g.46534  ORF Transcript_27701/g.46534 Transcript_27701/m.46534 type:complete len:142 (-) Transcript_27701:2027-2452(-)